MFLEVNIFINKSINTMDLHTFYVQSKSGGFIKTTIPRFGHELEYFILLINNIWSRK